MKSVILGKIGRQTSVIGYGCAGLMRPNSERERHALLHAAFDSGIRHFDIARYYGHGGAEGVLGKFLSAENRREQVTVTTKFGIDPSPIGGSSIGKTLVNHARRISAAQPRLRKWLSGVASQGVRSNRFDPRTASLSLETSLRELRTECIDVFLLHEATLEDTATDGLLDFLIEARDNGKIRGFGLGSRYADTAEIISARPAFASIVQIANGLGEWNLRELPPDPERFVIAHGALKILPQLSATTQGAKSVNDSKLAGRLLGLALSENPCGITLFSSTHPDRVRDNVRNALEAASFSSADWVAFRADIEKRLAGTDVR